MRTIEAFSDDNMQDLVTTNKDMDAVVEAHGDETVDEGRSKKNVAGTSNIGRTASNNEAVFIGGKVKQQLKVSINITKRMYDEIMNKRTKNPAITGQPANTTTNNSELSAVIEPFIDERIDDETGGGKVKDNSIDEAIIVPESCSVEAMDDEETRRNREIAAAVLSITGQLEDRINIPELVECEQSYSAEGLTDYRFDGTVTDMDAPMTEYIDETINENTILNNRNLTATFEPYNNETVNKIFNNNEMVAPVNFCVEETVNDDQILRESAFATIEPFDYEVNNLSTNINTVELYDNILTEGNDFIELFSNFQETGQNTNTASTAKMNNYDGIDEGMNTTQTKAVSYNTDVLTDDRIRSDTIPQTARCGERLDEQILYNTITEAYETETINKCKIVKNEIEMYSEEFDEIENVINKNMTTTSIESHNETAFNKSSIINNRAAMENRYEPEIINEYKVNGERVKTTDLFGGGDVGMNADKIVTTETHNKEIVNNITDKNGNITLAGTYNGKGGRNGDIDSYMAERAVRSILNDSFEDDKVDYETWQRRESSAIALIQNSWVLPFKTSSGFMCFFCSTTYSDIEHLTNHTNLTHTDLDATEIKRAMNKKKKHHLIKVNITNLGCRRCDDVILHFNDLKKHISAKHGVVINETDDGVIPYKISNGGCECALCGVKFAGSNGLSSHMNEHFPNHTCIECGVGFMTIDRLKSHSSVHTLKFHECEVCGKTYKSGSSKYNHYRSVHDNARMSKCPYCEESFKTYYSRQKHISTAHGIEGNQFTCTICLHPFLMKHLLASHMQSMHAKKSKTLERPHKCTQCDMRFTRMCYLADHMVKHTGARNFQCTVCLKWYGRKKTLTAHMKTIHATRTQDSRT